MELSDFFRSPGSGLPVQLALDALEDYLLSSMTAYLAQRVSVIAQETQQSEVSGDWAAWFEARPAWNLIQVNARITLAWNKEAELFLRIDSSSGRSEFSHHLFREEDLGEPAPAPVARILSLRAMGRRSALQTFYAEWFNTFKPKPTSVEWMHDLEDTPLKLPLAVGKLPTKALYPFLEKDPLELYDQFRASPANVLLLIGPPGTGKTSFIRGFLQHTRCSATLSFDPKILEKDRFFAEFLSGGTEALVLEDADNFLHSREDGNEVMHRFLSIGNGLVSLPNKKLIFSTNLQSLQHIDAALTRPGRCFAVLNFRALAPAEVPAAAQALGVPVPEVATPVTLAELASGQKGRPTPSERRLGF